MKTRLPCSHGTSTGRQCTPRPTHRHGPTTYCESGAGRSLAMGLRDGCTAGEVGLSQFDLRQRTLQSIGANSRRFETLEMRTHDMLECPHRPAARPAEREMARHHQAAAFVQSPGGESGQGLIAWMMPDVHVRSPRNSRKRPMARRSRDLTVPSGISSSPAMAPWARPSKNASCTTRSCSPDSRSSAARTR